MHSSHAVPHFPHRLAPFDLRTTPLLRTDVLVIGSGIGGACAALHAADAGAEVLLLAKDDLVDTNTAWAQGGIAVVTLAEDSLAALDRLRRKGERFDLVIADPPSFSHGPRGDWSVTQDLGRLVAACCRVLGDRGWLLVASNHGGLSPKDFGRMVLQGSQKAEVPLRLLHEGSTPLDFPAALSFPESRYLKCWVLSR